MKRLATLLAAILAILGSAPSSARAQNIQAGTLTGKLKLVATVTPGAAGAPTFGVNSGDPRFLFVGEQGGRIRTLDFSLPNPLTADFLNMPAALAAIPAASPNRGTLNLGTEKGLLGAAFHPDFNNAANPNGYRKFYTYTNENYIIGGANPSPTPQLFHQNEYPGSPTNPTTYDNQIVIREWTAALPGPKGELRIDTAVEPRAVMRIGKPGQFHNAGAMQFGPDGYLYFSIGDGGNATASSNGAYDGGHAAANNGHTNPGNPDNPTTGWGGQGNAQDRRNIFGKIIRIKPTTDVDPNTNDPSVAGGGWRVPKTNPFTSDAQVANPFPGWQANWLDEIYAHGFRNPFRISFDRETGDLYAADVGQDRNTFSREEISKIVAGGNYGWVAKSGTEINTNSSINTLYPLPPNLINPIAQYPTTQNGPGGLAVIGGFVYRGSLLPHMQGKYIFGDLDRGDGSAGRLLYTDPADASLNVFDLKIAGTLLKPSVRLHGVAEDARGEIYFLFENGQVIKLVPEPTTWALALIAAVLCSRRRRRWTATSPSGRGRDGHRCAALVASG